MSSLPKNKAAVDFLQIWKENGPWVLTAISVDRKQIDTTTFSTENIDELGHWLETYNGVRNCYFHVNPCIRPMTRKAEREDILSLDWLHVDIDPRAGEPLYDERIRALDLLRRPPGQIPLPTIVIFSGGGYQGFWKLAKPIPLNGSLELAEEYKLYNKQLEVAFGGDNCHNVDRIMRLPGTVNIPDPKKEKKGRVRITAELVDDFPARQYLITDFTKSLKTQLAAEVGAPFAQIDVGISSNANRLNTVDELDTYNVPTRIKVIIVAGRNPDEGVKAKDDSRSAWLFDCLCGLARAGVPSDKIFAIVTDPDFKISESVLDKGKNAERYAKRQISRAVEYVIDPNLQSLNEKHAVIENYGGKCLIVEEVVDSLGPRITFQSFPDFKNRYSNQRVQVSVNKEGAPVFAPLGKWWLEHASRRQYESVVFDPSERCPKSYNLWKGFACDAVPGDCELFLTHIKENLCGGKEHIYDYLIGWMACAVQRPDSPGHTAVVLRGAQGVGKSFFAKVFGSLFGRHFMQVSDPKHLVGSFNAHLQHCVVLFSDEAFFAGDKKHEGVLKTLITEETITIERKGVDTFIAPNSIHLILASNSDWVVPVGPHERRFLLLDVADKERQKTSYFRAIDDQLKAGGLSALLHKLMNHPISHFDVRKVPRTEALAEHQLQSLDIYSEWWFSKLDAGRVLDCHDTWEQLIASAHLCTDFIEYARRYNVSRRGNSTQLGIYLRRMVPDIEKVDRDTLCAEFGANGLPISLMRRMPHYKIPGLAVCRARWEKTYGSMSWSKPSTGTPGVVYGVQPSAY